MKPRHLHCTPMFQVKFKCIGYIRMVHGRVSLLWEHSSVETQLACIVDIEGDLSAPTFQFHSIDFLFRGISLMCLGSRGADNKMLRTFDHPCDLPSEMEPPAGSDFGLAVQLEHTRVAFVAPGRACFVLPVRVFRGEWPAAALLHCLRLIAEAEGQLQQGMRRTPHPAGA